MFNTWMMKCIICVIFQFIFQQRLTSCFSDINGLKELAILDYSAFKSNFITVIQGGSREIMVTNKIVCA